MLSVDPNNEEALRATDTQWWNGQLLTRDQIASAKKQQREVKQAVKTWKPKVAKWQRAIAGDDAAARQGRVRRLR